MRITPSILARQAVAHINQNADAINASLEQLGTGRRIRRASDDPTGTVLALRLQRDIVVTDDDRQRVEQALPYLQAMDSALNQAIAILQRARALVLQASNDTLTSDQRTAIAKEMEALRSELVQVANARIGDRYLFAGTNILTKPFVTDLVGNVVYQGNNDQMQVALGNDETVPVTASGASVFQAGEDVFAVLKDAIAAMNAGDTETLRTTLLNRLDAGVQQILNAAASFGAQANRSERTIDTLQQQGQSFRIALSPVLDADIADAIATYQLRQTTLQATLFAASRILPLSLVDFMA
ncbi:Flagellin [bacterium HR17]|uniref:Flagellin n=1 Tax=Candidatus Fervidibacter japonicus TaxID=2035412 RepID=A0A2H5XG04_9BACT|nr:Flagellin [bacterium HR17]